MQGDTAPLQSLNEHVMMGGIQEEEIMKIWSVVCALL